MHKNTRTDKLKGDVNIKKTSIYIIIIIVILICFSILVYYIGHQSVHRTNISHGDQENDISDPNIDIIRYRSYEKGNDIILELTVAGTIQNKGTTEFGDIEAYTYGIIVVAKRIDDSEAHIYHCSYVNGTVRQYNFEAEVSGNTLKIIFPKSAFQQDSYMIGLEAVTCSPASNGGEIDETAEDRDASIPHRWF